MLEDLSPGSQFIIPDWPGLPSNIRALVTTRAQGASLGAYDDGQGGPGLNLGDHVGDAPEAVALNRAILNQFVPKPVIFLSQIHSTIVRDAAEIRLTQASVEADASVTNAAHEMCAVLTADCLPVLFAAADGSVVAAAHAGWRGLAQGVLENTVAAMREKGAQEVIAWLGPAIGPSKFEVGEDVLLAFLTRALCYPNTREIEGDKLRACFSQFGINGAQKKMLADIYELARLILNSVGVTQVAGGLECTVSDAQRFYSYRLDRQTGRMASLIWRE
ncbi:MAG: peptidoglycan editing factor PgeF [Burkholderiales bacterium]|nr:peptidoglycan editing factor PgeF [Burkholderiales bacterium]